ncbi:VanZ family protein [Lederbergia sp. NSJ-179]
MKVHQLFVPGRGAEVKDVLIDRNVLIDSSYIEKKHSH